MAHVEEAVGVHLVLGEVDQVVVVEARVLKRCPRPDGRLESSPRHLPTSHLPACRPANRPCRKSERVDDEAHEHPKAEECHLHPGPISRRTTHPLQV